MKKLLYTLLAACLCTAITSCDLDTSPTNAVEESLVFTDASNAEKVVNGTWSSLMDTYYSVQNPGWSCVLRTSDAMGNDAVLQTGKYGYLVHYQFNNMHLTNATTVTGIWTFAYKAIDNCNHIITKIDGLPGDANLKSRVKAQAYALRGYIYLNLATFYQFSYQKDPDALCVPIYTEPSISTTVGKKRSPLKDVYKQAADDLKAAHSGFGSYKRDQKYKIDKRVTAGLLARTYLQMGDWATAATYANEAQTGVSWMTQNDYLAGFNDLSNSEWIWGQGQTLEQDVAGSCFDFIDVSSDASDYYSFMADPYFKDFFDTSDVRFQLFEWDITRAKGYLMYKKFRFRADLTADVVLMRKAEMVLIEAECLAEQNQLSNAIAKLNELRTARGAGTPSLSTYTKDQLVEEILIERRKELFGEGFALSDILRRQKSVVRVAVPAGTKVPGSTTINQQGHHVTKFPDGTSFVPNSPYYLFAIPVSESTNNPNL